MTASRLPLDGIRILDLGQSVAVPVATLWLAYMGAQVVRIESRYRGITMRNWPPFANGIPGENRSGLGNLFACNKLSCTLDLSKPLARDLVRELVCISDVVVENFSTGVAERMGFGYQELSALRPDLIMVSLAAFGRSGPMKGGVGFHSAVALFSGLSAITGYPGGHPRIPGSVLPDVVSGTYVVLALVQALYNRAMTGQGQYVELAMTENVMSIMPEAIIDYTLNGRQHRRMGNGDIVKAPHGIYPCRGDDAWISISVEDEAQWEALCRLAEHPDWLEDQRFAGGLARWRHQEDLDRLLAEWTRRGEPYELMHLLQQAGVPAGPALSTKGLLEDPHLQARGDIVTTDHPEVGTRSMIGIPWRISGLPPVEYRPAPLFGQHVSLVLGQLLGLPEGEIQRLVDEGVVA
ncbi:MAG: CoA transferase [Chloroflexi bacterium]|nr:CoA transferase [Chloroflexota bacterium]